MENSDKKRHRFKKIISDISDLSKKSICEDFLIHTVGCDELVLENYKGIIEYNDVCVKIKTNTRTVKICGQNLEIANMADEVVCVTGGITSVVFE